MFGYGEMLRRPGVARVLLVQFIAPVATQNLYVAIVLLALDRFNSPTLAGVAALASQMGIIAMPVAGAVLTRFGEKRTVLVDFVVSAVTMALIASLSLFDALPAGLFLLLLVAGSITSSVTTMGLRNAVTNDVPDDLMDRANAAVFITRGITRLIGPAMAGIVSALARPELAVFISAFLYVLAALVVAGLEHRENTAETFSAAWVETKRAVGAIRSNFAVRRITLFTFVAFAGWATYFTAMPTMVEHELHRSGYLLALLYVVFAVADITTGVAFGRVSTKGKELWLLTFIGLIAAVGLLVVSTGTVAALIIGSALLGACETPVDQTACVGRQRQVERSLVGIVMPTVMTADFAAAALGMGMGGVLAGRYSAALAMRGGTLLIVVACVSTWTAQRKVAVRRSRAVA